MSTAINTRIDLRPREALTTLREGLAARYWQNAPIEALLRDWSDGVDGVLRALFDEHLGDVPKLALFAVGGFGRQELHPASDIDLLIVAARPPKHRHEIERFMQAVFDLNLEVGHSVRTPKACYEEARFDITVATALLERRFICGDADMVTRVDKALGKARLWPADKFFLAKYEEQTARHANYDDHEYNLEPNIKTSPGGLRDIHTALWICQRQFGTSDPEMLCELGVLTAQETTWLIEGRRFIWWVRFGLHLVAERKEDRLQFAHQRELAERLGFADTGAQRGVERFMHHYYRHVLALMEVNDILIQHFRETVVARGRSKVLPVNERFRLVDGYIEAVAEDTFARTPSAMLELFVIITNNPAIGGVRASTIRAIRDHLHLIDDTFRDNPEHHKLFIDLLKGPHHLVTQLTRMRRYGILGRYIPEFGRVIGQMQHDMFHIYTVDAHTMMVVRNMRLFRYDDAREQFPIAYHCVHNIPKIELLYIAGFYHDIGKGRGGDHSQLGAVDARAFCERHGLSETDTELVVWLVAKHLYMSSVAQRADIYDPDVVHSFATEMKSEMRLDYLYALTVADMYATNPTLWNSWRATLMHQLYTETRRTLRRGLESASDKAVTIAAYQDQAMERLATTAPELAEATIRSLWADFGEDFFLRHTVPQISALTETIAAHTGEEPFIAIHNTQGDLPGEGATRVYVYTPDQPKLFARTVATLAKQRLSVVDAQVNTGPSGMCLDVYTVLTSDGSPLPEETPEHSELIRHLQEVLADPAKAVPKVSRRLSRQQRELTLPTEVTLAPAGDGETSILTIIAADRPGLLAAIAEMLIQLDLQLRSAKIATLGERVEDTFVVQNQDGEAVADGEATYMLAQTIRQRLDRQVARHR